MLKERIGGTSVVVAKREDACNIVPSPPKVAVISTFCTRGDVMEGIVAFVAPVV